MTASTITETVPNPVVRETALRAYPGWVVRQYRDGMYDATDGVGLTLGVDSFQGAVACVREQERGTPIGDDVRIFRPAAETSEPPADSPFYRGQEVVTRGGRRGTVTTVSATAVSVDFGSGRPIAIRPTELVSARGYDRRGSGPSNQPPARPVGPVASPDAWTETDVEGVGRIFVAEASTLGLAPGEFPTTLDARVYGRHTATLRIQAQRFVGSGSDRELAAVVYFGRLHGQRREFHVLND